MEITKTMQEEPTHMMTESSDKKPENMGERIFSLRREMGMTQEDLAERAGVSSQFISYAESGKRSVRSENLLRISQALHVSVDYLLTGDTVDSDYLPLIEKARRLPPESLKVLDSLISQWLGER